MKSNTIAQCNHVKIRLSRRSEGRAERCSSRCHHGNPSRHLALLRFYQTDAHSLQYFMKKETLMFYCEGCEEGHMIPVNGENTWTFNNDFDKPTVSPSVLVQSGHYCDNPKPECWCNFEERTGEKSSFKCQRCHTFIRDGMIEYLSDCSHFLAGKTVRVTEISFLK